MNNSKPQTGTAAQSQNPRIAAPETSSSAGHTPAPKTGFEECKLGRCPLYKGECLRKGECLAEEKGLIGTHWDHPSPETSAEAEPAQERVMSPKELEKSEISRLYNELDHTKEKLKEQAGFSREVAEQRDNLVTRVAELDSDVAVLQAELEHVQESAARDVANATQEVLRLSDELERVRQQLAEAEAQRDKNADCIEFATEKWHESRQSEARLLAALKLCEDAMDTPELRHARCSKRYCDAWKAAQAAIAATEQT